MVHLLNLIHIHLSYVNVMIFHESMRLIKDSNEGVIWLLAQNWSKVFQMKLNETCILLSVTLEIAT